MKLNASIRITAEDYDRLRGFVLADLPNEGAAFVLAGVRRSSESEEVIARRVVEIPASEFRSKKSYHLDISPRAINGLIALCERNDLGVILCHSHPTDSPYSPSDDFGEERIARILWQFLPDVPVGSLLVTPNGIQGRIWKPNEGSFPASELTVIGRAITKIPLDTIRLHRPNQVDEEIHGRQILAFGKDGQTKIAETKIAVVGVGGTGSSIAEQLLRMGVEDLVLVDKEVFSPSNITRVYGSNFLDAYPHSGTEIRMPKVDIVARHLEGISPKVRIQAIKGNIVQGHAAEALLDRDFIFCCTDEHWGRSIVNQIGYQYLIPVINLGVRIDSDAGKIQGAAGSLHVLRPGKPCLWCYRFLDAQRIRAESLPLEERQELLRQGYVQDIDTDAPSVVSLTTTISGLAVTTFLQLVTDFMGLPGDISCLQYLVMEGTVRRGTTQIQSQCICQSVKGFGDRRPLPTLGVDI